MRTPLDPRVHNATSRLWAFWVNVVAASPLLSSHTRYRLYRRFGIETESEEIGPACYFQNSGIRIGRETLINHGCHFENVAPVEIGSRCAIGIRVTVLTSTHDVGAHHLRPQAWHILPVHVEDGCWIGSEVTILPGVRVGERCVIAAGSVVNRDCEPAGLYAGVPARRVRDVFEEERPT